MKKLFLINLATLIIFIVSYQLLAQFSNLKNFTPGASLATVAVIIVIALMDYRKFILVKMKMFSAGLAMTAVLYASISFGLAGCFKTELVSPLLPISFFVFTSVATLLCAGVAFFCTFHSMEKFYYSKIKKILISSASLAIIWGGVAIRVFLF